MYREILRQDFCILILSVNVAIAVAGALPIPSELLSTSAPLLEVSKKNPKLNEENGGKLFHLPISFRYHQHGRQNSLYGPSKDSYSILLFLRKVQGADGLSPVCKICRTNYVDATTYDFFCLPDSAGMDGEMCDALTILGTTRIHHISAACKLFNATVPAVSCY